MKHKITGKAKVGGLVFSSKAPTIREWYKAGCPDSYVRGSPDQLMVCRIPFADAIVDRGIVYRSKVKELQECEYALPWYILTKPREVTAETTTYDYIVGSKPNKSDKVKFHR